MAHHPVRALVAVAAALAGLVLAAPSFAAVTPRLVVSDTPAGPGQTLTIAASKAKGDDPIARIQFFVPTGFALNSPAPGAAVGTASGKVVLRDLDPTTEHVLHGKVTAISPTDPAIAWEGANCDASEHLAAWLVQLSGKGASYTFPVYVDSTSTATAAFGPYMLVACFRPADLAATDPNRSPKGALIDSFSLDLKPFARPDTGGDFRWRSLWTPYTLGTGAPNQTGNVEAQSVVVIPTGQIVIFGKKSSAKVEGKTVERVEITGQVLVQSEPVGPVRVTIRHGSGKTGLVSLGGVLTGKDGGYTKFAVLTQARQYYQASATVPPKDLGTGGCQASFAGTPCLDATSGAGRVVSGLMLVRR
jgi:hypothetical protein